MPMDITQVNEYKAYISQRLSLTSFDNYLFFPKYFEIETVRACNSKCIMCTISDWRDYGIAMSDVLYEKIVEEISRYADWIHTVCLSRDGEPLLDPGIVQKIRMLKMAGIKNVTLTSNAQLLTEQKAKEIIDSGLDDIMLSLDGITKYTYEKIRTGLNFETVVGNITNLIKLRDDCGSSMSIRIRFVHLAENELEIDSWLKFWKNKVSDIDRVYVMPMHTWGGQLNIASSEKVNPIPCVFLFSSLAIHADGSVGQCNVDYNSTSYLGSIQHSSIKEVWNGNSINKLRELHLKGSRFTLPLCQNCSVWERTYIEAKNHEF
jgi:radical SAM protein with 4Fe4S-binding SPASM domain